MNNTGKRKDWIKNIAIVFLAILLVLTFFSNTIKNYSLPEVAAQYTSSGSITNKIRGSGTVEASDPYSVVYKAGRKVASVSVRTGDEVQKGDVLYVLEDGESDELKAARQTLESLQNAYEKGLVLGEISKDLTEKVENGNIGSASELQAQVNSAKKKVENAKSYLESLQRQQSSSTSQTTSSENEEIDKLISNMQTNIIPSVETNISNYGSALASAKSDYLSVANADISVLGKTVNVHDYLYGTLGHFVYGTNAAEYGLTTDERNAIDKARYELTDTEAKSVDSVKNAISLVKTLCEKYDPTLITAATSSVGTVVYSGSGLAAYSYDDCITNNSILKQKSDAIDTNAKNLSDQQTNLINCKNQITLWENQKKTTTTTTDDLTTKIANAQASLESAEKAYSKLVSEITTSYDLMAQLEGIESQKKIVEDLEKEQGASEITAPVSGTILSMYYVAGETIDQGATVTTIQVAGKGYTLSYTIPAEKVRLISIGDEAEITNSWWYSDVHARIMSIKPDPSNPSKNKIVTFELDGSVSAGQTLSFSVGSKSANYDSIVPNSAIHEDNKGKFIYRINSKSTPLGNRYIIERIDVTVLASDDNQSAVSGALDGWDYIVTTSSKPIEDGTEVRLKD